MFLVETYYEDLIGYEANETLKFFSELKVDEKLMEKLNHSSFKRFVRNLKFEDDFVKQIKIKYDAIV